MSRSTWIFTSAFLAGSLVAPGLLAHVNFVSPQPRHPGNMNIKVGPCGVENDARDESRVTVFEPGETIMITFSESIQHPGFFRISFDDDGQDAFVAPTSRAMIQMGTPTLPVLVDNIADTTNTMYTQAVTLPNIQCENCTLQLIQVMTTAMTWAAEGENSEIYYTCADIALRGGAAGAGGAAGSGAGGIAGASSGAGGMPTGGGGQGGIVGMAGASGSGFAGSFGGAPAAGMGGVTSAGSAGISSTVGGSGGVPAAGGASPQAGSPSGAGGPMAAGQAGTLGAGGSTGGTAPATGGTAPAASSEEAGGCTCTVGAASGRSNRLLSLAGLAALGAFLARRRRR